MNTNLLHPYPAMIAPELAERIATEFLGGAARILDPFCGTSRTLYAAAPTMVEGVGLDLNPLAVLISRAKAIPVKSTLIDDVTRLTPLWRRHADTTVPAFERLSGVSWLPARAERELAALIAGINRLHLAKSDINVVAAILSATIRDVSYARPSGWKMHRMAADDRARHRPSPITRFLQRLHSAQRLTRPDKAKIKVHLADARRLTSELRRRKIDPIFDAIVTSPPYGDSQTTVQYGGLTRLVWPMVSKLDGFELADASPLIDAACLGGSSAFSEDVPVHPYWAGPVGRNYQRVGSFLSDIAAVLDQFPVCVRSGGRVVLVVARRSVGGFRQNLDQFCTDHLESNGFRLTHSRTRQIVSKILPRRIVTNARSNKAGDHRIVSTMRSESLLVFRRR